MRRASRSEAVPPGLLVSSMPFFLQLILFAILRLYVRFWLGIVRSVLTFDSAHFIDFGDTTLSSHTVTKKLVVLGLLDAKVLLNVTALADELSCTKAHLARSTFWTLWTT